MIRAGIFLCITMLTAGCMTPEDILAKLDEQTEEMLLENSADLTEMAGDSDEDTGLRCYAIKVLGRLNKPDETVISTLGSNVTGAANSMVRAWSSKALGKMGRPEAAPYLIQALKNTESGFAGYYALEALARMYQHIIKDKDIQEKTLRAITTFTGNLKEETPTISTLLYDSLSSLAFCVSILEKDLKDLNSNKKDQRVWQSTYRSLFNLLKFIEDRNKQIASNASKQRMLLENGYQFATSKQVRASRTMSMLAAQGIGLSSNRQGLADLAAPGVIDLARSSNDSVRLVSAWSLSRLQLNAPEAKKTLRNQILLNETNSQLFQLLADIHNQADEFDEIQKVFNLVSGN